MDVGQFGINDPRIMLPQIHAIARTINNYCYILTDNCRKM